MVVSIGALAGFSVYALWGPQQEAAVPSTTALARVAPSTVATTTTSSATTITTPAATASTIPAKGWLVIQGTGDVNLDPGYIPALAAEGWDHAWSGLDGLFLEDDLTVVNLECAPSDLGNAEPKEFVFRCPSEALPSLASNGVEVANLGNNHSGDYGKEAMVDGRANLLASGVAPVGAGRDVDEAGAPALFEVEGWTIAVVGFGGVFPNDAWVASEDTPGMRNGDDTESMVEAVEEASALADLVVVTIHWGVELDTTPRPDDVERAEAMIAAGADIIFGHHPHRLQPFDLIDGRPVFWSLGNFVWPNSSVAGSTTAVARAVVSPDGTIEGCLIPAMIESPGHPVLTGEPSCRPPS
ncbi:MAG TPA: CapA family protein [Acidimicrobiia bacterium]|nr:CapA family protein [Acidimicrobiia bacterium]